MKKYLSGTKLISTIILSVLVMSSCTSISDTDSSKANETTITNETSISGETIVTTESEITYKTIDKEYYTLIIEDGITPPEDIEDTIDLIIKEIESKTKLSFYDPTTPGIKDKFTIYFTTREDYDRKAITQDNMITIYSPYFDTDTYGISILTHELTHVILFHNLKSNSLALNEGVAEFYGDKICLELDSYPIYYESYEYGTGIIKEPVNNSTAKDLFLNDLRDCISLRAPYQYGTMLVTFLYETYGDQWLPDFINAASDKESITIEETATYLERITDNNLFTRFSLWYANNKERFRYKTITDSDLHLYDY